MKKDMKIRFYIADALSKKEKQAFEEDMRKHPEIREEVNKLRSLWNVLDKWDIEMEIPPLRLPLRARHFPILYPAFAFGILGIILGVFFTRISRDRYYNYVSYIDRGFYEK